ncbi:MAG: UDP-3-O-[3-hydroxymyristoyl] N-acetylglucosamine deacetylase [Armatimonadetes bacterium CP1_7O]|nr:MAG: UDP-3-O-[3-hydroxymyristoyl] N-acetylglucosamine deacetylase [Armatimonadetes bacterium CP1_7O]
MNLNGSEWRPTSPSSPSPRARRRLNSLKAPKGSSTPAKRKRRRPHRMATAKTLRETLAFEGVGLHSGERCKVLLHPSNLTDDDESIPWRNQAIRCHITVRKGGHVFPARWEFVVDTTRATVLGDGTVKIGTVEHLMAALWMMGITHCVIEVVQGDEIPILDGSALPFVEAIRPHAPPASPNVETRGEGALQLRQADRYLALSFSGETLFGYIHFPEPLGVQAGAFPVADSLTEIAPARTFGFLREVEALRRQGLARGGALENALVIGETGYHNPARFEDEPLRHKLLDVLGDLYLSGVYLPRFTLVAVKPGHALNVQLARMLAQRFGTED